MIFDECWNKHLNTGGDRVTLEMINKYGISAVRKIAELAWEMSKHASQQPNPADAESQPCGLFGVPCSLCIHEKVCKFRTTD
ncbi:MAG: hypothetical protein KKF30_07620 [Proteobacteria bacterium]|nr:hypothetical protein [Pseudomonadota bacterium]MBU4470263.1 hypothetical protein [Pseudomonadota bacterium]MCG2752677.1 hypothetical protein [Desulfobacteraceae bacterium]